MQPTFKIVLGLTLFFQTALCAMDVEPVAERPRYHCAVWQHIGRRPTQEDTFFYRPDANPLFAVFDGHGKPSAQVSQFAAQNIVSFFDQARKDGNDVSRAIDHALAEIEKRSRKPQPEENWTQFASGVGSTAEVVGIDEQDYAHIKNIGDSVCMVLDRVGSGYVMRCRTHNHAPYRRDEAERIFQAGGIIEYAELTSAAWRMGLYKKARNWGQLPQYFEYAHEKYHCAVIGQEEDSSALAVTRALGDSYFKEYGVSAEPESLKPQLLNENSLVLLVSDGATDAFADDEIAQKITHLMAATGFEFYHAFANPGLLEGNNERLKDVVRVLGDCVLRQRKDDNVTLMLIEKAKNQAGENHDAK